MSEARLSVIVQGVGDRHRKRIGTARRQYACSQRVGLPDHRQQRIGGYDDFGIRIGRAFLPPEIRYASLLSSGRASGVFLASSSVCAVPAAKGAPHSVGCPPGLCCCRRGAWGRRAYGPLRTHIPGICSLNVGYCPGPRSSPSMTSIWSWAGSRLSRTASFARLDERFGDVVLECRHFRVGQGRLVLQRRTVFTGLLSGANTAAGSKQDADSRIVLYL